MVLDLLHARFTCFYEVSLAECQKLIYTGLVHPKAGFGHPITNVIKNLVFGIF